MKKNQKVAAALAVLSLMLIAGIVVVVAVIGGGNKGTGGNATGQVAQRTSVTGQPGATDAGGSAGPAGVAGSTESGSPSGSSPSTTPASSASTGGTSGATSPASSATSTGLPVAATVEVAPVRAWVLLANVSETAYTSRDITSETSTLGAGTTRSLSYRLTIRDVDSRLIVNLRPVSGHALPDPIAMADSHHTSGRVDLSPTYFPPGQYYLDIMVVNGHCDVSVSEI